MTVKLYRNARIFTPLDSGCPLRGKEQGKIKEYVRGAILSVNGLIEAIGDEKEVLKGIPSASFVHEERDMEGACVIPGFVDPHTHLCFAKRREDEFKMRLDGLPYLEILKRGGGILSSVKAVRSVTEEELFHSTKKLAMSALAKGTTTVEIKSGYGLDLELELKMLSVISRISRETPLDVIPTFMGAHAVPTEFKHRPDDFVDIIINEMLPKVKDQGIAEFCDIFCEEGVFSVDQSRKILKAAKALGFEMKIHADEVHDLGGAGLAAELGVRSAEHLLAASEENLRAMGRAGSIAVLLPATAYSLKKPYARGREMIDWDVPVALATDCNPGSCFCESVPFIFGLGVMNMNMTIEEALVASTLNAAYAVNRQHKVGSLEPGKQADFLVLDGETPTTLAYHVGNTSVLEVHKLAERVA